MSTIYKTSDKIPVKIEDITVKVSPLTYSQKTEVQDLMTKAVSEQSMKYAMDGAILAIKYSLKSVEGLKDANGENYQIEIEDKQVTDECIDDLLNMKYSQKLSAVCASLVHGVGRDILDENGQKIEGISFEVDTEKK